MTQEVKFEVDVSSIGRTHGITLSVTDQANPDEPSHYFMLFDGDGSVKDSEVAVRFSFCHGQAMSSVGILLPMPSDEFDDLLVKSVEIAGSLMSGHGFRPMEMDEVDRDVVDALMAAGCQDPLDVN